MFMPCVAPPAGGGGGGGATSWELNGLTYTDTYTSSEVTIANGLSFNADGTKMYLGNFGGNVYQYTLSTEWDLTTASYASKTLDVTAEGTAVRGIEFKTDGTKLYVTNGSSLYQYSLSVAWDLSTATYDSVSFNFTTQTVLPVDTRLSSDGTKMYTCAFDDKAVYQYSLSSAWDISSASYASKSKSITEVGTDSPNGLFIGKSGTKMYVARRALSSSNDFVYQYGLSVAYDVSTASYESKSLDFSANSSSGASLFFSGDGSDLFIYDADKTVDRYSI